jgi:hypothetical protein
VLLGRRGKTWAAKTLETRARPLKRFVPHAARNTQKKQGRRDRAEFRAGIFTL